MILRERLRAALDESARRGPDLLPGDPPGPNGVTPAAVLVAVTDRPEPGVILTQRPDYMRSHPGQVAFPGGRIDPDDDGAIAAALREAEEEIALPRDVPDVVGTIESYTTLTAYRITPVIAVIPPDLPLEPHAYEVADIFEVPLAHLLDVANHIEHHVDYEGAPRRYFEITFEGRSIWGVTAGLIVNLGRRLSVFA